jgi:1-acyl-sn-glycerol-3-phosphate acyltransferase
VRVCFLPVINSSGKDRHSVGIEARDKISEKISKGKLMDNLGNPYMKSSRVSLALLDDKRT